MKILFVCTGNTCRSPMAEYILRELDEEKNLDIRSRGTHTYFSGQASRNAIEALEDWGIDLKDFRSKALTEEDLEWADLVLTMTEGHRAIIDQAYPEYSDKIASLIFYTYKEEGDILDPFSQNIDVYRKTRDQIKSILEDTLKKIRGAFKMIVGLASDHGGFRLKEEIKSYLLDIGYEVRDYGTDSEESVDYPLYGRLLAYKILEGDCDLGIAFCGTGIGISIAANKVKGARAALCSDTYSARMSREHNDANILALGGRVIGSDLAKEIVKEFLNGKFQAGRHERRVKEIE